MLLPPVRLEKVPAGQGAQSPFGSAKVPAPHDAHTADEFWPRPVENNPVSQAMHADELVWPRPVE